MTCLMSAYTLIDFFSPSGMKLMKILKYRKQARAEASGNAYYEHSLQPVSTSFSKVSSDWRSVHVKE